MFIPWLKKLCNLTNIHSLRQFIMQKKKKIDRHLYIYIYIYIYTILNTELWKLYEFKHFNLW
jgi:hypothetical protein